MWAFCEFVPAWIELSVRLCLQVLMWAFCKAAGKPWAFCEAELAASHVGSLYKAVLAGAGSVRLSWRAVLPGSHVGFLSGCPGGCQKKQGAICEAELAGVVERQTAVHVGFL